MSYILQLRVQGFRLYQNILMIINLLGSSGTCAQYESVISFHGKVRKGLGDEVNKYVFRGWGGLHAFFCNFSI